jgi:hypothetical protein
MSTKSVVSNLLHSLKFAAFFRLAQLERVVAAWPSLSVVQDQQKFVKNSSGNSQNAPKN